MSLLLSILPRSWLKELHSRWCLPANPRQDLQRDDHRKFPQCCLRTTGLSIEICPHREQVFSHHLQWGRASQQSTANLHQFPLLCWCPDSAGFLLVSTVESSASHLAKSRPDSHVHQSKSSLKYRGLSQLLLQNCCSISLQSVQKCHFSPHFGTVTY